ncbi:MAG: peptide chain release factor-like protein [Thermoguttaceae bacterium]|nr:peptide chain release factor-like protein [Thermoguttaceae bacterium]MDW8038963.1 peptide chain release factor-like protein [Thermoguttaceae bacterium]
MHPAAWPIEKLLSECQTRRLRRGGPGGQHRNKVETAWWICHLPSGITAEANERRQQAENRQEAVFRLRVNLALEVRQPIPVNYQPSWLWQRRCQAGRVLINPEHDDFPALLAEALDVLAAASWDPKSAAQTLQCTPSQLVKFLKKEPRALALVNRQRAAVGLHRLQ